MSDEQIVSLVRECQMYGKCGERMAKVIETFENATLISVK